MNVLVSLTIFAHS